MLTKFILKYFKFLTKDEGFFMPVKLFRHVN
jgi:hypothetical protein